MGERKLPRLRVAAQEDRPALVRLINLAYRVESFFIQGERTSAEEVASLIQARDSAFLLLADIETAELVGSVYLRLDGQTAHVGFLAVDPSHQGQGLGHRLLQEAEAFARRSRCSSLELDVFNVRKELPAFYRSAGFEKVGTSPFSHPELLLRPAHLIRMRKQIPSA